MRFVRCLLIASAVFTAPFGNAQQPSGAHASQTVSTAAETLHTGTQLVIVDVVVQDSAGRPIHGLTRDNFVITEQKKRQAIRNFEEHSATANQQPGPSMPALPPGVFTNYTPVPPDSTLNILLIDALNTPMDSQIYLRQQLLDYVKRAKPGIRVAVFGLANRLIMLQGFTSDPEVLRATVEHRLMAHGSTLLDDPVAGGSGPEKVSDLMQEVPQPNSSGAPSPSPDKISPRLGTGGGFAQTVAAVQQFEAEQEAMRTGMRTQLTLDAFNALAHYLSNFPGRKNLIWFSGSFPLQIDPDPTLKDGFSVMMDSNSEFRETTNLLIQAQTAVYPVDARGLLTAPIFGASESGKNYVQDPANFGRDVMKFSASLADEHATMEEMALNTGGHAFYDTNGLSAAITKAIDAGSNYYTLTYSPGDKNRNGSYRKIHVDLTGTAFAQGAKLEYRHGYYADDAQRPEMKGVLPTKATTTPAELADHGREAYTRAAISRGAPAPSDILFKVRVVPLTGKEETSVAADNRPAATGRMKAPYRTFAVDYVTVPGEFSLAPQKDGRHTGGIELITIVYDADGRVLNGLDKQLPLDLSAETYKQFEANPVHFRFLVSAPVKQESFMRLIIRDVPTNRYGVVEIPTADVTRLQPLEARNVPAASAEPSGGGAAAGGGKQ